MDQMDWYFSRDGDDHVVPQGHETLGPSSSLDYWLQWGGGFSNLSRCGEFPMIDCCGDNSDTLQGTGCLGGWPKDEQLDGQSGMGHTDDIFMSSFVEEVPSDSENPYGPVGMSYDSECSFDNLSTDMIMDFQSIAEDQSDIHSSKHLKMSAFPLSENWDELKDIPHFLLSNAEQRKCSPVIKAPVLMALKPGEPNASPKEGVHVDEEASLEETMLQELEVVMTQWTQKTRIRCRDAMYRLAKSSKQHLQSQSQSGELTMDEPRIRKTTLVESEMNTFDNTIAHLLFNNLNCNTPIFPVDHQEI